MNLYARNGATSREYGEHNAVKVHNGSLNASEIIDKVQQCAGRVKIMSKEAAQHTIGKQLIINSLCQ